MSQDHLSCLCGAVTATVSLVEPKYHICHCHMCRQIGAGPRMSIRVESLETEQGMPLHWYQSSEWAERGSCDICRSNLAYRTRDGSLTVVSIAALENGDNYELGMEIFIDSKPDNYDFVGDHPRLTGEETQEYLAG